VENVEKNKIIQSPHKDSLTKTQNN